MSTTKDEKAKATHTRTDQKCVGELCWNPSTERLEFKFDSKTCPTEIRDKLKARTPMVIKDKGD